MSLINRLIYFSKNKQKSRDKHIVTTDENRNWESFYRNRWQFDKVVRSTHGVNCTGSCSWKIYVKSGLVTWEVQQTDYPETRPDLPNHEPRGCPRGASYSWYLYSANRVKHPAIRATLLQAYRNAKAKTGDPVKAWASVVEDKVISKKYKAERGLGGMVRADWDEMNEIIAAANIYTIKTYGPDRIVGFTPIPAMSMVSYASGTRYLSLIGGTVLSFYDFYCDLPPSSPQTWGEQTDVPESADWYNSSFLMLWGSNVPLTRTPDAPFYTQVRYKGTKIINISPDFNDAAKFADLWMKPKQGTDAALGMAMGHVILKEFYLDKKTPYFEEYARQYTDLPFLVKIEKKADRYVAGSLVRASDMESNLSKVENAQWKPVLLDAQTSEMVVPNGTIGSRWDKSQRWNLELKDVETGRVINPILTIADDKDQLVEVSFPYFGGSTYKHEHFAASTHSDIITRKVPVKKSADGKYLYCTVFDLMIAHYGISRGYDDDQVATDYHQDLPYTPAWQETITGVPAAHIISTARQFAENAAKTKGKSMIIIGAGVNHWFHTDMIYRSAINMLMFCGCVGKSGGGWAHYVGQEKLRPQTGWLPLAFGLDWNRPPRQMNTTSFFYMHTDQWRYEKVGLTELVSPLADQDEWGRQSMIDCNVKAERMGWLPSSPQLSDNPLRLAKQAEKAGVSAETYITQQLKSGALTIASEDPDNPKNFPRNLFVWRSNLIGSSSKGMEYFTRHLLGTQNNVLGDDLKKTGGALPREVVWHDEAPEGKLDLLVTLDFRMSTTTLHSDIILPAATWYEKNDLSTTDMHPFIHPFSKAVDPVWEARSDWEIFKGASKRFSELTKGHLAKEKDIVLLPLLHDSPMEISETADAIDWKTSGKALMPGKNMSKIIALERDYPETYHRFTTLGPLMVKAGNGAKGINWNTDDEVEFLKKLNKTSEHKGETNGLVRIESDVQAAEVILTLAPETNGHVAVKAWQALGKITGREHAHLARSREDEKIRFKDLLRQPRKIITSPIWSGVDSEEVSYNAGYTNVHELIPWRTLTGRQTSYQDHPWMLAFGENLVCYKPPLNTKSIDEKLLTLTGNDEYLIINMMTPHNKWTIHSSWSDNLIMLTLGRGGPVVWMSEIDAEKIHLKDNDWVEVFNLNGASVARLIVSQRIPEGALVMYHNQERTVNMPTNQINGNRGGVHNSVERLSLKPTHMIGGYAQLAWGFNYYGTIGSNRDEFVIVRKLKKVEWNDEPIKETTNNR
ncbi:MAG: nitrate reductase subunit alpha [Bacteroidales bacterium]|jgi:nitrate reductase alpha subunit|nr:nitrate reductase subunit alpha [Bacteroidales bacterium]NCU36347.1 nitrate reductase subunit alpha [Candidatus Falkowbacteria bacterium]MDD2633045.1 nitrate reductase subunit alpha [Bacteroidales bacterium]MDD4177629.1 nitrate reductase subunit alpha [Bacteroidales bacterium]MDD4742299.1 nitrate reductase subunit alpha [Bacteroidales bacterium]